MEEISSKIINKRDFIKNNRWKRFSSRIIDGRDFIKNNRWKRFHQK